jgi:hypothetical protein
VLALQSLIKGDLGMTTDKIKKNVLIEIESDDEIKIANLIKSIFSEWNICMKVHFNQTLKKYNNETILNEKERCIKACEELKNCYLNQDRSAQEALLIATCDACISTIRNQQ